MTTLTLTLDSLIKIVASLNADLALLAPWLNKLPVNSTLRVLTEWVNVLGL